MELPALRDPERILMVGDLHGDLRAARRVVELAVELGAHIIVQVGDFGFFPYTDDHFDRFLEQLDRLLAEHDLHLWFVDGNHDNHAELALLPAAEDGSRPIAGDRWVHGYTFTGRIRWLPRGHRWVWGGFTWVALGGAYSVNQDQLAEGWDWWREETVTDAQAAAVIDGGPADVMVAHDAPWVDGSTLHGRLHQHLPVHARRSYWPARHVQASDQHQKRLRWVLDEVQPMHWFHGHHHWRYTAEVGGCTVDGLGKNGQGGRYMCLLVDQAGNRIIELD